MNKYRKAIFGIDDETAYNSIEIDVYEVLEAFQVQCPAVQHAIKQLLFPGARGSKSARQDLEEARASIDRAIQLEIRRNWLKVQNEKQNPTSDRTGDSASIPRATNAPEIFDGKHVTRPIAPIPANPSAVHRGQSARKKSGR